MTFIYLFLAAIALCGKKSESSLNMTILQDFSNDYCPNTQFCFDIENKSMRSKSMDSCCQPCSCDTDCGKSLSCCTDSLDTYRLLETGVFKCISTENIRNPHSYEHTRYKHKYLMVYSCPQMSERSLAEKCDHLNDTVFGEIWPVFSNATQLIYKNQYCAACNGASDLIFWDVVPTSNFKMNLEFDRINPNTFSFVNKGLRLNVRLLAPMTIDVRALECDNYLIDRCNLTTKWDIYDRRIEEACLSIRAPYFDQGYTFRNIFCYMCNEKIRRKCTPASGQSISNPSSTQILLSFKKQKNADRRIPTTSSSSCNSMQFFDPYKLKCSKLLCPAIMYRRGDQCLPKLSVPETRSFEILVNGELVTGFLQFATVEEVRDLIIETFQRKNLYKVCTVGLTFESSVVLNVSIIEFHMNIATKNTTDLYVVLSTLGDILQSNSFKRNRTLYTFSIRFRPSRGHHDYSYSVCGPEESPSFSGVAITLKKTFFCNLVEVKKADIQQDVDQFDWSFSNFDRTVTLTLNDRNTSLSYPEYSLYMNDNGEEVILVCLEDYLAGFVDRVVNHNSSPLYLGYKSVPALLSVVCSLVSIVCIIISLIIYCLHKELRSLPGKLNMILMSNLAVAQVALTFGVGETEIASLCVIVGFVIHFAWMSAIFWMTASCFQMFCVFHQVYTVTSLTDNKLICIYIGLCHGLASVLVLCNFLQPMISSGLDDFGYGPALCYINSSTRLLLTFTLPIAISVGATIGLYIAVGYRMYRHQTTTQHLSVERSYIVYCVRLASITGLTWISGFLYELTGFWLLEYCFVSAMSLQGLLIMLSFVCKRRVFDLCRRKF